MRPAPAAGLHDSPVTRDLAARLAGPLLSALTRLFVKTVLAFYRERGGVGRRGQSGAVV